MIKHGYKSYDPEDGDTSGRLFSILPASLTDADAITLHEEFHGRDRDGEFCRCHYDGRDCCGQSFTRKARVRRTAGRVLVTQYVAVCC